MCVFSCHFLIFKKFAPKVRFEDNFKKRRYGSQKETAKIKRKAEKVSFTGGGGVGVCVCVAVGCGECKKAEAQVTSAAKPWQVCGVGVGEVGASVVHRWWWVAHCAVFASVWKCVMWCVSVR